MMKAAIFIEAATKNSTLNPTLDDKNPQITLHYLKMYRVNPFPSAPEMSIQYKNIFF